MGKKDKRRKRMKNFVQNKQRQEKAKQGPVLSAIEDKNSNNINNNNYYYNNTDNNNGTTTLQSQTIVHNITTTNTLPDNSTITENTALNVVTDTYESITPVDDTIHNSPSQSLSTPSPPLNIGSSIENNDTASLSEQQQQQVSNNSNMAPHSLTVPSSIHGSLAPIDPMNSEIPNVSSIPELDLDDQEETGDINRKKVRSTILLTPVRKWASIGIIYLLSIVIGFDLGKTWIYQSTLSSKFQQFYNTSQLLTFVVLGYWLQNHFRANLSIRNHIIVVSILEMFSFFTLDWAPCFPLLLMSRLLTGILVGLFFRESLIFFENIGPIRYRVPSHIYLGILYVTFFNNSICNWLFYGAICLIVVSSFIVLPNTKSQIEISSYLINRQSLSVVVCYIIIQFLLSFMKNPYKFILAFVIAIPLYVYIDNSSGSKGTTYLSSTSSSSPSSSFLLLSNSGQDKLAIVSRIVVLLLATISFYSLPIYLDIFQEDYDRVYCLLFGVLFGSILLGHISYRVALFTFILTLLDIIITGIDALNVFIEMLLVVAVGCFVIMYMNTKPLQRGKSNNYTFETIIIISGLIVADALVHVYPKRLIYDGLMEAKSKKHPYNEILEIVSHSDKSVEWIRNSAPTFALKIIKSCYKKSFTTIWLVSGILSVLAFVLTVITKHLE